MLEDLEGALTGPTVCTVETQSKNLQTKRNLPKQSIPCHVKKEDSAEPPLPCQKTANP